MDKKIILASSSPRRIEIMRSKGYAPEIMPADIDETLPREIGMRDAVMYLALKKALWVEGKILGTGKVAASDRSAYIIAADTVVYKDEILGKPADREDARRMLASIRDTSHQVATGVAIIKVGQPVREVFCDVTDVYCKDYSDADIEKYLDTDEPYDKAGAYAIQGIFATHIDHYDGRFDTVVGFPWDLIEDKLNNM